jgi:hypothetical protein
MTPHLEVYAALSTVEFCSEPTLDASVVPYASAEYSL